MVVIMMVVESMLTRDVRQMIERMEVSKRSEHRLQHETRDHPSHQQAAEKRQVAAKKLHASHRLAAFGRDCQIKGSSPAPGRHGVSVRFGSEAPPPYPR